MVQSRGVLGFGGVFVASIFAQTLSMTSTGFNAMVDSLWSGIVEVSKTLDTKDVLHDFCNLYYVTPQTIVNYGDYKDVCFAK